MPSHLISTWSYYTRKMKKKYPILLLYSHYSSSIIYNELNNFQLNVFDLFIPHTVCFEPYTSYFWPVCCNTIPVTQECSSIFTCRKLLWRRKCLNANGRNKICRELNAWCYFWIFFFFFLNASRTGKRINTPRGVVNHSISHQSEMHF